jgi:excisionase family DNA binding protein
MQACAMLSIGLTRCYELMNAGELESFKDGKSRKITVTSIKAYIDRHLGAGK